MVRQKPVRDRHVVTADRLSVDDNRATPAAVQHSWSVRLSGALIVGWTVGSEAGNDIRPVEIDGVRQRWGCSN